MAVVQGWVAKKKCSAAEAHAMAARVSFTQVFFGCLQRGVFKFISFYS